MLSAKNTYKIRKLTLIIISGLFLILFISGTWVYFRAEKYLNNNLSKLIYTKTKGVYIMTFDKLDIDFENWGFSLKNVDLNPNDSIINTNYSANEKREYIVFKSPNIQFTGINILKLLISKKLKIHEIIIDSPLLKFHSNNADIVENENDSLNFLSKLNISLSKSLKSININKIEFRNASIDFYNVFGENKKLAAAKNITFEIHEFYTDIKLLNDKSKLYETGEIYLKLTDYNSRLADSIHILRTQKITYSLKGSSIDIENLELKPFSLKNTDKNTYNISIANTTIRKNNISELVKNKNVDIDLFDISEANIQFRPGDKKSDNVDFRIRFDLYSLIKEEFESVKISKFKISNSQLTILKSFSDSIPQQKLQNFNIIIDDFDLSSKSIKDTTRVFFAKNFNLDVNNFSLLLGDNTHIANIGNANVSSLKKTAALNNIVVSPLKLDSRKNKIFNTINVNCDSIRLKNFDLIKAYHNKMFVFSDVIINKPSVNIFEKREKANLPETENTAYYFELVSNIVNGIYADKLEVQDGSFKLKSNNGEKTFGDIETELSLLLRNFSLDEKSSKETDKLFYAKKIELNFDNYKMKLADNIHKLTLANLYISSEKKIAKLKNLHLAPINSTNNIELLNNSGSSELYDFKIPELSLTNTSFNEAFFNKQLHVDTLKISNPHIYYENFAFLKQNKPKAEFEDLFRLLSVYLLDIKLNSLLIPNGNVKLINHSRNEKTISLNNEFSLKIDKMHINEAILNEQKLLFSENIEFIVRNHTIKLADKIHVIKAAEVGIYTKKKEIFVINAKVFPETGSNAFKKIMWNVQLSIPEIRIQGIDINQLYYDKIIEAENIKIRFPEIRLYQKQIQHEKQKIKDFSILIPDEISSLSVKNFSLLNGSLKVFTETEATPYLQIQSDIKVVADNIIVHNKLDNGKPEFISGNYITDLMMFKYNPKNKNMSFLFDELKYSSSLGTIQAKNFTIRPKNLNRKLNQFELKIPSIIFKGFSISKAYNNDEYQFETILIEKPWLKYFNNKQDTSKIDLFKIDLFPYIESFAELFTSKELKLNEAKFTIFKNNHVDFEETISLFLEKLRIDKNRNNKFLHSENFSINLNSYQKRYELYDLFINKVNYSSARNSVSMRDIQFKPRYNKDMHQYKVGFQSDYISASIDSVNIIKPDIQKLFEKNILEASLLNINKLELDLYRDKNLPFNTEKKSKMIHDLIKSIKFPVKFDSVKMSNSKIIYSEKPVAGQNNGQVWFSDLSAGIKPFTNIKNNKGQYPDIRIKGSANLMDSCKLNIRMYYYMNNTDNLFNVGGELKNFNFRILNPITIPLASVLVRSGSSDLLSFSFSADKRISKGELKVEYDDLKISVIDEKHKELKELKFASFMANILLMSSNKNKAKELIPKEIYFERDPQRSDFYYWWKSVFSGVKNTLGINQESK